MRGENKSSGVHLVVHVVPPSVDPGDGDVFNKLDEVLDQELWNKTSSNDLGLCYLLAKDLVNLQKGDEITLVISIDQRGIQ